MNTNEKEQNPHTLMKDGAKNSQESKIVSHNIKPPNQGEIKKEFLKNNFGVEDADVFNEIIKIALKGLPHYASISDESMKQIIYSIKEMKPSDAIETKLCAKESSLYSLAMQYVRRAESGMFSEDSDIASRMWYETNMNYAIKLLRLHNETIETLSRYRRKGEQKVIVQHVNVNDGGKAIVGGNLGMAGGG